MTYCVLSLLLDTAALQGALALLGVHLLLVGVAAGLLVGRVLPRG